MGALKSFIRSVDRVNDWIGRKICFLVLIIFGALVIEVFLRYFLNAPTIWANELSQLVFGIYCILSGGYLLLWKEHVGVDLLYARFSLRGKALANILVFFIFIVFCGTMIISGVLFSVESISMVEHSESPWNPPIYPFKSVIPVAALMLMLQGIANLIRDVYTLIKGEEMDANPKNEAS